MCIGRERGCSAHGQVDLLYVLKNDPEMHAHPPDSPFEPVHEISNNVACATSKASDTRSLIRAFASRLSIL